MEWQTVAGVIFLFTGGYTLGWASNHPLKTVAGMVLVISGTILFNRL